MQPASSNLSTAGPSIASPTDAVIPKESHQGEPRREYQLVASGLVLFALLMGGAWMFWTTQDGLTPLPTLSTEGNGTTASSSEPQKPVAVAVAQPQSVHADVYFASARSRLSEEAKTILQAQATRFKDGTWAVLVQGYTDSVGPATYNKALGLRRAQTVKDYLVELGVPASAITALSLGKDAVICQLDTIECLHRNRRVHLELIPMPAVAAEISTQVTPTTEHASEAGVPTPEPSPIQDNSSASTP